MHGRAELQVDCSAESALIYWFDYCSISRSRTSSEEGNLARTIIEQSDRSSIVGTVKTAPWPFYWREFVFKTVWKRVEEGYILGTVTVDDKVDYGKTFRGVRGRTKVFVSFERVSGRSCKVRITQVLDLSGLVPAFVMNMKLQLSLSVAEEMREAFEEDDEIDKLGRMCILRRMQLGKEECTEEEEEIIDKALKMSERAKHAEYRALDCSDPRVSLKSFTHLDDDPSEPSVIFGQAEVVVDALPEVAASWEFLLEGRKARKNHFNEGGIDRNTYNASAYTILYQQVRKIAPGIQHREWRSKGMWKKVSDDKYLITYSDTADFDEMLPIKPNVVRASAHSILTFERLPDNMNVPQTKFTFIGRVALNGIIPHQIVDKKQPEFLTSVGTTVRKSFDKSDRIDRSRRDEFKRKLEVHDHNSYTHEENNIIDAMLHKMEAFDTKGSGRKKIKTPNSFINLETTTVNNTFWGRSNSTVRASPEAVLAYFWDTHARHQDKVDTVEKTALKPAVKSDHVRVDYIVKKAAHRGAFHEREFVTMNMWKLLDDDTYLHVCVPIEHTDKPRLERGGKTKGNSVMPKTRQGLNLGRMVRRDGGSIVEWIVSVDMKGNLPGWINLSVVRYNLHRATSLQQYFSNHKLLEEYEKIDGEILASSLMAKLDSGMGVGMEDSENDAIKFRVKVLFKTNEALRKLGEQYEFFEPMMVKVIKNKLRPGKDCEKKLNHLSVKDGERIGASLAGSLATNVSGSSSVGEWLARFPAMREMASKYSWFEPMMTSIGTQLLGEVSWGLKSRMIVGASLSFIDLVSDLLVGWYYLSSEDSEEHIYGWLTFGMVAGNIFFCTIIALVNHSKSTKAMLYDLLWIIVGMKPVKDAMTVTSGSDKPKHSYLAPVVEMTFSKCIELFAEAIPACCLQIYALILANERKTGVIISALLAALTTGFNVAIISYDMDTSPSNRKNSPWIYGYIPDKSSHRTIVFLCIIINGGTVVLSRALMVVFMCLVDFRIALSWMLFEMILFLAYKAIRRDFRYWIPFDGDAASMAVAVVVRVICKIITDFTSMPHFRHPFELGGFYWTLNLCVTQLGVFTSAYVYTSYGDGELPDERVWQLIMLLFVVWLTSFLTFLLMIKRSYVHTFISSMAGHQYTCYLFHSFSSDELKASVLFTVHRSHWISIHAEVAEWVGKNWDGWVNDKQEGFEDIKGSIPESVMSIIRGKGKGVVSSEGNSGMSSTGLSGERSVGGERTIVREVVGGVGESSG
ncbi:hypothetical protein TL16_g08847 [Triparma laevis f. inornata]|uniref:START domain-containing protein n=1 Tax=Triparma laevis f. inornata TaxID=1714386 RepID=A0A9W7B7U5_9STRA|nr:hypothetical protein TL16_g08847 [Triparma laevis f. inornata]